MISDEHFESLLAAITNCLQALGYSADLANLGHTVDHMERLDISPLAKVRTILRLANLALCESHTREHGE